VLGPLDKWSNAGCDFLDRHGYYGGPHQGERASYALSPGDRYDDASALLFQTDKGSGRPVDLPLFDVAYGGKPSSVSELNWVMPNRFRAELPVLAAAYGALQGTDALMFFATNDVEPPQVIGKFAEAGGVASARGAICRGLLERIERTGKRALRLSGDGSFVRGAEAGIIQNILKLWHEQIADLLLLAKKLLVQRIDVGKLLVGQLPCLILCTASHENLRGCKS